MRKLLYVPTIHNKPSLVDGLEPGEIDPECEGIARIILNNFWDDVFEKFSDRRFDVVYFDGVTQGVCMSTAREFAEKDRGWAFVYSLMKKGTRLMRTENQFLFHIYILEQCYVQRYKEKLTVKNLMETLSSFGEECFDPEGLAMLKKFCRRRKYFDGLAMRDSFVARTVEASLRDRERGLLLMGGDHDPLKYINGQIEIEKYISPHIEQLLD